MWSCTTTQSLCVIIAQPDMGYSSTLNTYWYFSLYLCNSSLLHYILSLINEPLILQEFKAFPKLDSLHLFIPQAYFNTSISCLFIHFLIQEMYVSWNSFYLNNTQLVFFLINLSFVSMCEFPQSNLVAFFTHMQFSLWYFHTHSILV